MAVDFYQQQKKNVRKTIILVGVIFGIAIGAGVLLDLTFLTNGIITAVLVVFVAVQALIAFGSGSKIVLKSVGAKEVLPDTKSLEEKQLLNIADELSISSGMTRPKVYVMNDPSINAFATGTKEKESYVCVTTGLLNSLNREETEGVVAHEIAHIKNRDVLLMTIVSALVGGVLLLSLVAFRAGLIMLRTTGFIAMTGGASRSRRGGKSDKGDSQGAILAIIAAIFATALVMFIVGQVSRLMTFAISRKREFLADATAVEFTRNPNGLTSAFRKIYQKPLATKQANGATAHLFISEPKMLKLAEKRGFFANLLSTHPPLIDRIAVLEAKDRSQIVQELQFKT